MIPTQESAEREALLPCPFCGSQELSMSDDLIVFYVECLSCCASSSSSSYKTGAELAWNRRATLSQQGGGAVAPGYKVVPVEPLQEIVTDIRQHIAQGVGSEALVAAQRPGYGAGIYTYLKHKMDDISAMLGAAPPAPQEARGLTDEQVCEKGER